MNNSGNPKIKNYTFFRIILILTLTLPFGLYFRLYPLINHVEEESSEKATIFVLSQLRKKIQDDINKNYPDLIPQAKDFIRKQLLDKLLREEKDKVNERINTVAKEIRTDSTSNKSYPYLLASDSFYYYELTENIINNGRLGKKIKGSKYFNDLMLAPNGHWVPLTLHPYVGYIIYQTMRLFNKTVPLMLAVSYTPLVITVLSVLLFISVCGILRCGTASTALGSLFFLLAPIFVKRSTFGWYDNDPYNVLFPLAILLCMFVALKKLWALPMAETPSKSLKEEIKINKTVYRHGVLSGTACAALLLLYTLFWQGWMLLYGLLALSGIALLLHNHFLVKSKGRSMPVIFFFGSFLFGSFILISLAFGVQDFFTLFSEGWTALKNFLTPQLSIWPDIYISVGELHPTAPSKLIGQMGGVFFFIVMCIGVIRVLHTLITAPEDQNARYGIILLIFAFCATFMALGAQRFIILCVMPWALLFTFGIQGIMTGLQVLWKKIFREDNARFIAVLNSLVVILLFSSCVIPLINMQKTIKSLLNPIFNSVWEKVLLDIKEKTPENSIVNAWWAPGHFISSISRRKVTFDGGTINFPQAYWMANVFLSPSEKQALGILRMLNNSGNKAAEKLHENGMPVSHSVDLLKDTVKLDEISARIFLNKILKDKELADSIINLTHPVPPPSYLLIYKEFVEKNLQLAYIGRWNFAAVEQINGNRELLKRVPKRNSPAYIEFLWSLVGGRLKYSGVLSQISRKDNKIIFPENIIIDLSDMTCAIKSNKYGTGVPFSIFYERNGQVKEKKLEGSTLPYSIILLNEDKLYEVILLDRQLAESLLVRLFYFKGEGLKYFRPFTIQSDITGRNEIQVYEIDWDKFEEDLLTEQSLN